MMFVTFMVLTELAGDSTCKDADEISYNLSVSMVALGFLLGGAYVGLTVYSIIRLYFAGNPLAYNEE